MVRLRSAPRSRSDSAWMSRPVDLDHAGVGPIQAAEDLQQRGLAGAGGADDRQPLAARDLQFHAGRAPPAWSSPRESCAARRARDHATARSRCASVMPQRLGRLRAGGAPGRIQRRQRAQRERHAADAQHVAAIPRRPADRS